MEMMQSTTQRLKVFQHPDLSGLVIGITNSAAEEVARLAKVAKVYHD
jgi:hypothetical protein